MALCVSPAPSTLADVTLSEAVEIAVQGRWADEKSQSITLGGHGFYVRPVSVTGTSTGITAEGFFRHRHRGKDDRIYYSVVAMKEQPYKAIMTRIEYRGVLNSSMVEIGVDAAGAASGGVKGAGVAKAIIEALKKLKIQRALDGNWEPQAAKVVDAIGARLAAELK
jgi:hypothetical protein